ncbi:MAG: DUF4838 domain-containing protein [Oscillospiraceae bacterium]|nr:DUF4838 domain-containing protein [Oscillospiraceae bacterium]
MRKINRLLALVLCCVLLLSVCMTGCGQEPAEQAENTAPINANVSAASRTQGIDFDAALGSVTEYSVILSSLATQSEKYAAQQLVTYVKKITGVSLPYASDGEYSDSKVISVGRTAFLESSGVTADTEVLSTDGFVMKNKGNALLICGGSDRGTIYGVLDFLEYHLGVKFLTADCTYIPNAEQAVVYACDRTEIPAFAYRVYLDADSFYNRDPEFQVHHRFTSEYLNISEDMGGNMKWWQGYETHNALAWAKTEQYVVDGVIDPMYTHAFSNDGTKIIVDPVSAGAYCQYAADLCYSDGINEDGSYSLTAHDGTPTALGMAVAGMKEVIRSDENENNYYMFGQNDYFNRPCLCPKCIEGAKKYTDAGIMIRFINALADNIAQFVAEEGIQREVSIVMFAYQYSSYAPVNENSEGEFAVIDPTCKLRDNVVVRLAPINNNRFVSYEHPAQNDTTYGESYMQQWSAITDRFMLWDYTTWHGLWYWAYWTLPSWHDRLTTADQIGVEYVLLQSTHQEYPIYQSVLERYVLGKLLWNPNYDVNELIAEFHKYYLGDIAAPYATEYVELMITTEYEALEANGWSASVGLEYASKALLENAIGLLDQAVRDVEASKLSREQKDVYIQRLEVIKLQPRYMYLYHYMQYETDETQMKIEIRQFIRDAMSYGAVWCREGCKFDLDNLIFY